MNVDNFLILEEYRCAVSVRDDDHGVYILSRPLLEDGSIAEDEEECQVDDVTETPGIVEEINAIWGTRFTVNRLHYVRLPEEPKVTDPC